MLTEFEEPPSEAEVFERFRNHDEELQADLRAMNRLYLLGEVESTVWPTLCGGLLFFHLAELVRAVVLTATDPNVLTVQHDMTADALFMAAILSSESHPYPAVRRRSTINALKKQAPEQGELVAAADERVEVVFAAVREHLRELAEDRLPEVQQRWC